MIKRDGKSLISVRSSLERLSAAYGVHTGIAEFAVAYLERGEQMPMSEKFWREE